GQTPAGQTPAGQDSGAQAPPTLRARGLDDDQAQALSYSGPSETGDAEVKRSKPADGASQGTRRERRAEQRAQAKKNKGPKPKKKSR
ncbi:MAG: hypothetical protein L0H59_15865, partial [Tomitella sp.]|nr:hypothetical protein [Tomitella sp.]